MGFLELVPQLYMKSLGCPSYWLAYAQCAVVIITPFATMSTGMMSARDSPVSSIWVMTPRQIMRDIPPAAAVESVHPSKGSLADDAIIDGLNITTFKSPCFFLNTFSVRFLVKVYVLGKLPINLLYFCAHSAGFIAIIFLTCSSIFWSFPYISSPQKFFLSQLT